MRTVEKGWVLWRYVAMLMVLGGILAVAMVAWKPELLFPDARIAVEIAPREVLSAGAGWKISSPWTMDGEAVESWYEREREVEFRPVAGWVTPRSVPVPQGRGEKRVRGEYTPMVMAEKTVLRMHGSNTIGANLAPDLAERYLLWLGAEQVHAITGSDPSERVVEGVFPARKERLRVEIKAHGSSTGFAGLREDVCDVAMASRRIKDKEREALRRLGDMCSLENEYVIALDGIAVIVNRSNPLTALSKKQIADIFAGRVNNWRDVGLPSGPIVVHARNDDSGTFDTFRSLVLGRDRLVSGALRHESNAELSNAVADDPLAIGFCGLPYIDKSKELAVQDEGAPIKPSVFTVSTEDYPLARRLYLYAPARRSSAHVRQFLEYVLAQDGQAAVTKYGFVSLDIGGVVARQESVARNEAVPAVRNATAETARPEQGADFVPDAVVVESSVVRKYEDIVSGGTRVPVNFRFHSGGFELDNKAVRDLDRIAALVRQAPEKRIALVGFSDSVGASSRNLELSRLRAQSVADRLAALGVRVGEVLGVGEEVPVASNQDMAGREKNRRVEVWVL